jgi:hypothetical protein
MKNPEDMSRAELMEELRALMSSRFPDDVPDERYKVLVAYKSDRMLALSNALAALPADESDG